MAIQRYVDTASSGGDGTTTATAGTNAAYASLSSWEANGPWGGAATDDYIVDCYATGGAADTTATTINFVTPSSGSIKVQGGSGTGGKYTGNSAVDTSSYRNTQSGASSNIAIGVSKVTIDGIQLVNSGAGGFASCVGISAASVTNIVVQNCSMRSNARACFGTNGGTIGGSNAWTLDNNVMVYTGSSQGAVEIVVPNFYSPTHTFRHNTIYTSGSVPAFKISGGTSGSPVTTIKNNICTNTTAPFSNTITGTISYDSNGTDAGTSGTTNEITLTSAATALTSPGTTDGADFTLKASTNGASGLGISTDKRGTARASPPDIGAYEVVSGGTSYTLTAGNSTFAETGVPAVLKYARVVGAATGTFALTGQAATLTYTQVGGTRTLVAAAGTFAETGIAATLKYGRVLTSAKGTFTETGQAANLVRGRTLAAARGTFTETGIAASFRRTYALSAAQGSYTFTGMTATLTYSNQSVWTKLTPSGGTWTTTTPATGTWTTQT